MGGHGVEKKNVEDQMLLDEEIEGLGVGNALENKDDLQTLDVLDV